MHLMLPFSVSLQGNVRFDVEDDDSVFIKNRDELRIIASLLGIKASSLEKTLCYRVVAAKGEVMEKGHSKEEASHGRDAFAKVFLAAVVNCIFISQIMRAPFHPYISVPTLLSRYVTFNNFLITYCPRFAPIGHLRSLVYLDCRSH